MGEESQSLSSRIIQFAGDNPEFIPKDDVLGEQDAAASQDIAQGADLEGKQGEDTEGDGLDTASDEEGAAAEQDETDDDTADESDQKDDEGKGTRKKTFDERMAELEAKLRQEQDERIAALEARFNQSQQQPQPPDFVEVDKAKVNEWLKEQDEKIKEAELDGDYLTAKQLQRNVDSTLSAIEENDKKREAWQAQQKDQQSATQANSNRLATLDKAAEFYRSELKIEPDIWQKQGEWFAAECQRNALVGRKFAEKVEKSGPIEAIEWAHKYTMEHMGQKAKEATQQKEQSKTKTAAVSAAPAARVATGDSVKAAQAAFKSNPSEENFAAMMAAKRKAKGA